MYFTPFKTATLSDQVIIRFYFRINYPDEYSLVNSLETTRVRSRFLVKSKQTETNGLEI